MAMPNKPNAEPGEGTETSQQIQLQKQSVATQNVAEADYCYHQ